MCYRSAKQYKKFIKTKEKQYYKQLNNKKNHSVHQIVKTIGPC